jgi:hypothetical protein
MVPTYNGWEDTPEDEREALEAWESASSQLPAAYRKSRASQALVEIYTDELIER